MVLGTLSLLIILLILKQICIKKCYILLSLKKIRIYMIFNILLVSLKKIRIYYTCNVVVVIVKYKYNLYNMNMEVQNIYSYKFNKNQNNFNQNSIKNTVCTLYTLTK